MANAVLVEAEIVDAVYASNPDIDPTTNTLVSGTIQTATVRSARITAGTLTDGTIQGRRIEGTITQGTIRNARFSGGTIAGTMTAGQVRGPITGATVTGPTITLGEILGATIVAADSESTGLDEQISSLGAQIPDLEAEIAALRQNELRLDEDSKQAQAKEDRAVEEQFRLQVAAAHEDPDTYAPAKKDSVDPVAQVSISVIGEGLIHLRGPIHGINTIREMINQIDSPVGQIKVEIHTVQINGEKGDRMEKVAGRVEGHLDLGRFLTNQSLNAARAVQTGSRPRSRSMSDQGGHYQVDRDRKYLYNFFGRDFIDELYEMDSEFLRSQNKLLSLHSMDTISLNRALFIMALAKNDVRERIVARFMHHGANGIAASRMGFSPLQRTLSPQDAPLPAVHDREHIEENTLERVS